MKCNAGSVDRVVRSVAGLGIITAGVVLESWWGAIGIVPLGTTAAGWCPASLPFGFPNCRRATG